MRRRTGRGALVPVAVAARLLGVDPRTLRRWIELGAIEGERVRAYFGHRDRRCRWYVARAEIDARTKPRTPRGGGPRS